MARVHAARRTNRYGLIWADLVAADSSRELDEASPGS